MEKCPRYDEDDCCQRNHQSLLSSLKSATLELNFTDGQKLLLPKYVVGREEYVDNSYLKSNLGWSYAFFTWWMSMPKKMMEAKIIGPLNLSIFDFMSAVTLGPFAVEYLYSKTAFNLCTNISPECPIYLPSSARRVS